jgi:hypothetical protein
MQYFAGLDFVSFDHVPHCSVWIDRQFPHYFALNYNHRGTIDGAINGSRHIDLVGPVAGGPGRDRGLNTVVVQARHGIIIM